MKSPPELEPVLSGGIEELAALWQYDEIVAVCPRPPSLAHYPELSSRIRGAWGRTVMASPGIVRRSRYGHEWGRAELMLTRPFASRMAGLEVPKPAVIRADVEGDRLVVRLRLFGAAGLHLEEAAETLATALEGGISLSPYTRLRTPVPVERILTGRRSSVELPDMHVQSAALIIRSPLVVRSGSRLQTAPASIFKSVLNRVSSMAFWQRFHLNADWRTLHQTIDELRFDLRELRVHRWQRYSIRQGDRPIPMHGHLGAVRVEGDLSHLAPFLLLAETCNTGSHASLGFGWFDLALYPRVV